MTFLPGFHDVATQLHDQYCLSNEARDQDAFIGAISGFTALVQVFKCCRIECTPDALSRRGVIEPALVVLQIKLL